MVLADKRYFVEACLQCALSHPLTPCSVHCAVRTIHITIYILSIHPKRWFPRFQDSADNFEFSAERLSENAKSIKITLFAELLTAISPIYVQSLLNLSIKTLKHTICSTKMPHWHQILVIFMIYALLSWNFVVAIYALFPQNFGDWKSEFRRLGRF